MVLKGTWWVGSGPKWDKEATTPVPAGSFVIHHPKKIHYDGAKDAKPDQIAPAQLAVDGEVEQCEFAGPMI